MLVDTPNIISYYKNEVAPWESVGMQSVTSKDLKNKTGEVLRKVRSGATVAITNRGRRIAVIVPAAAAAAEESGGPPNRDPWAEIEVALESTAPEHSDWREALRRTRRRS